MLGKLRASNLWIDHGQESCLYWYFNWVHMKRVFFWVVVSTFFYQCQKESWVPPHWEQQPVPLVMDFNSVYFVDSLRGFLAGGEPWKEGCLLSTVDGGRSWVLDTLLVGHKMEHITADSLGNVLAVGQYGHCFERSSIANTWTKYRIDYVWHRGAALVDGKRAVIVSGESFSFGEIRSFGPDYFWALDTQQMLPVQQDLPNNLSRQSIVRPTAAPSPGAVLRFVQPSESQSPLFQKWWQATSQFLVPYR